MAQFVDGAKRVRIYLNRLFTMHGWVLLFAVVLVTAVDWTETEHIIQQGIDSGVFSGCVLAVITNNATLLKKAYGTVIPKRGFYAPPVTVDMKFDLNYLTSVVGMNTVLMELYDQNRLNTTTRVSTLFFDFDNNGKRFLTLQNVLEHNSGLQAGYTLAYPKTQAELIKALNNVKLEYTTEAKFLFSELGLFVLGEVVQKTMNVTTLNNATFQIFTIVGMRDTSFLPKTTPNYKIVPGGYQGGIAQGYSYNKLSHFLNDSTGTAGLFSTVDNIINLMELLLNKGKPIRGERVFTEEVVERFLNVTTYKGYKNTRALGWETVPATNPPCGKKFSPSPFSFGMADTSGSYIWTDRKRNVSIILLANGNYPVKTVADASTYQGLLSDAIMTALGY